NGQVNFGLVGDYDAMADLDSFALDLEAATAETVATVPKKRARSRPRAAKAPSTNGSSPVTSETRS
ncbi:MAG: hypothetical protein QOI84_1662, partial [Solirubrobacterales bacterium]|nr:hypothetical protein [Solirubrobacterales bacterium]